MIALFEAWVATGINSQNGSERQNDCEHDHKSGFIRVMHSPDTGENLKGGKAAPFKELTFTKHPVSK